MSASAIVNLLVGLAIGGWLVFGGLAGKLADSVAGTGDADAPTATTITYVPVRPSSTDRPVLV